MRSILGLGSDMNPLQQMVQQIAIGTNALEYLVQYRTFSHTIDTAEDIHVWVERP
jgi:hypothetical protein